MSCLVGLLTMELHIPGSHSLKEKRRVVHSLKERLQQRFNISLAEVDFQDTWQHLRLAAACVSNDGRQIESTFSHILDFLSADSRVELIAHDVTFR
ncbi:MAG: DUF503 domain-containing protein [Calditrichaeota bacterium]|nr:DUF503 domain-containing protein [Calditrichota bacterium]